MNNTLLQLNSYTSLEILPTSFSHPTNQFSSDYHITFRITQHSETKTFTIHWDQNHRLSISYKLFTPTLLNSSTPENCENLDTHILNYIIHHFQSIFFHVTPTTKTPWEKPIK